MIIIPAILVAIAEAAVIGGLVGAVLCGLDDKRNVNSDADKSERTAHICAAQGAVVGGTIGAAFPFFGVFDDIAKPTVGAIDDAAIPATSMIDDVVRATGNAMDDAAQIASKGARQIARSLTRQLNAPLKLEANISRASYYKWLSKPKGTSGYVYVIEDAAKAGRYKIGRTIAPARRLREIRGRVQNNVNYICIIRSSYMRALERALHTAFAGQRLPNTGVGTEWFNLNRIQLAAACSQ